MDMVRKWCEEHQNEVQYLWNRRHELGGAHGVDKLIAEEVSKAFNTTTPIGRSTVTNYRTEIGLTTFQRDSKKRERPEPGEIVEEGFFRRKSKDDIPTIVLRCLKEKQSTEWDYRIFSIPESQESWIVVRVWKGGQEDERIAAKIERREDIYETLA
jgi:hypothetical protein